MKTLLLLLCFGIFLCNLSFAQSFSKQDTLYVESVDFNIETFYQIPCESFATNFKGRLKFRSITNEDTIAILNHFLAKERYVQKNRDIDVRAKLIYQKEKESTITICTDGYEILVDGRLLKHNNKFAVFLRGLTK